MIAQWFESNPEVLAILRDYYSSLKEGEKVEIKMHRAATGDEDSRKK